MSLTLDDPEVDRLAGELAAATGESEVDAVRVALRERLARVRPAPARTPTPVSEEERQRRLEAMREFAKRWREAPVVDPRPFDEILGYDENGLPT